MRARVDGGRGSERSCDRLWGLAEKGSMVTKGGMVEWGLLLLLLQLLCEVELDGEAREASV